MSYSIYRHRRSGFNRYFSIDKLGLIPGGVGIRGGVGGVCCAAGVPTRHEHLQPMVLWCDGVMV
jgi:hypothetical protein